MYVKYFYTLVPRICKNSYCIQNKCPLLRNGESYSSVAKIEIQKVKWSMFHFIWLSKDHFVFCFS